MTLKGVGGRTSYNTEARLPKNTYTRGKDESIRGGEVFGPERLVGAGRESCVGAGYAGVNPACPQGVEDLGTRTVHREET